MTTSPITRPVWLAWTLALAFAYAATAKFAIEIPLGEGIVSPIWLPAGIAIAGLMLLGVRAWPAITVGALVANATSGTPLWVAAGIGLGNAAEAVLAAWLLTRLDLHHAFDRTRDVFSLVVAGVVACVVAATNGVLLLAISGGIGDSGLASQWALWWFGDLMGVVAVTPVLLTLADHAAAARRPTARQAAEFTLVIGALAAASWLVFSDEAWRRPALLLPMWAWATIRFRALGASVGTFVIGVFGVAASINGTVAIVGASTTENVQAFSGLLLVGGLSVLAIAATVSERDAARERLEEALLTEQQVARELRRLDELKDRLLAAVSHELRTPLTSILALSTLLADDADGRISRTKRIEMHETIAREVRRLDALLTDLLDVERVRMGLLDADVRDVDLAVLVREVVDRHAVDERPTRIELEPVRVRVDPMMVDRIVDNLVTNARRHTPRDSVMVVRLQSHDGGALISVDDDGHGVEDRDKDAIFEPFHRGSADVIEAPGTGIGLSLVLQFAKLHGGSAWVEDRPGGGASFRVYLPG